HRSRQSFRHRPDRLLSSRMAECTASRAPPFEMWEAAGCPPTGQRPGEGDILATNAVTGDTRRRYMAFSPLRDDHGTIAEMSLWAGQGVEAIRDIPSAGGLVGGVWREYLCGEGGYSTQPEGRTPRPIKSVRTTLTAPQADGV